MASVFLCFGYKYTYRSFSIGRSALRHRAYKSGKALPPILQLLHIYPKAMNSVKIIKCDKSQHGLWSRPVIKGQIIFR